MTRRIKWIYLLFVCLTQACLAQTDDSTRAVQHFSGAASITNNGISLVPSFSLERPAALFLLSFGGDRFSVDPDIRFSLDGKPWTFLFWARYKLANKGRFRLGTGAHLGLNFQESKLPINGLPTDVNIVRRYLAGELVPNFTVAKNVSVGAYYLYARGLDPGTVSNTHFVTLNANFSHLPVTGRFYLQINPQIFYLAQDGRDGHYLTGNITLAKDHFPVSLSYLVNKVIQTNIPGSKDFISSVSIIYSFNRNYIPKQTVL